MSYKGYIPLVVEGMTSRWGKMGGREDRRLLYEMLNPGWEGWRLLERWKGWNPGMNSMPRQGSYCG